ncbi:hypothetical protein ACL9RL_07060 [Plantibacter sp. Mn2098]|uniref:hypothetical protein n=1 Tax=Plantibacter sp. Mn2098 TaxID=3395266 RepID=UPI003BE07101
MSKPRPIRFDVNTWLVMRGDPVLPKAIIERRKDRRGQDVYFVLSWDLDPGKRVLMGSKPSLEEADTLCCTTYRRADWSTDRRTTQEPVTGMTKQPLFIP